jgi:hypothetical protein
MKRDLQLLWGFILLFFAALLFVCSIMAVVGANPLVSVRTDQRWWHQLGGAACYLVGTLMFAIPAVEIFRSVRRKPQSTRRGFDVVLPDATPRKPLDVQGKSKGTSRIN